MRRMCLPGVFFLASLMLLSFGHSFASNSLKPVVRERVLQQLEKAQGLIDQRQFKKSFSILDELAKSKLSPYESSQVFQILAFQFYQQGNSARSIWYYEKILELASLPILTIQQTQYNLAQLYFSVEKYQAARSLLKKWFSGNENAGVEAYELLGQVNYLLKLYPDAISAIDAAVLLQKENNKIPKQSWLQLLQVMHFETGNHKATIRILEKLVYYYPKKNYWLQLASIYGETGNRKKQLVILDTAYLQGYLDKENELKTLAYLLIDSGAPFKAATLLGKAVDNRIIPESEANYVLLANAWRSAQETGKTIVALQQASKFSKEGKLDFEIAQLLLLENQYDQAIRYANRALTRQAVENIDLVYLTLGIAYYKANKTSLALDMLEKVKPGKAEAKKAIQWKRFILSMNVGY